jgi:predicted RNase H-like HicB family nuclease
MKYVYPAIFIEDDGKIGVDIPDIKGCHTFGDDLAEAMEMAKDALEMMLVSYEDDNQEIPIPSKLKDIKADGFVSYILADTDEWRREFDSRAVKKTLSIPSWLNSKAERADINFSQTLKEALCQKLGVSL